MPHAALLRMLRSFRFKAIFGKSRILAGDIPNENGGVGFRPYAPATVHALADRQTSGQRRALRLRSFPRTEFAWRTSATIAIVVGVAVLLGWVFGIEWIGSLSGTVRMKANLAASFVLLGLALVSLSPEHIGRPRMVFGMVCASVAALAGLATLSEWLYSWDLRIDQLLFTEPPGAVGTSEPGRMAATAAICCFLGGTAICLLRLRAAGYAQALSLLMGLAALLAFAGFLYDADSLKGFGSQTQMAVPASLTFMALAIGVLSVRSGGFMGEARSRTAGGAAARFLIPAAVVVPLATGWLALRGRDLGLYGEPRAYQLLVTANIAVIASFVWVAALLLNRVDAERERQRAHFGAIVGSVADAIVTRSHDGTVTSWNVAAERLFGYTADEVIGTQGLFLTPEELLDDVEQQLDEVEHGARPHGVETVQVAKDGRRVPVTISKFQVRGKSGTSLAIGMLFRDMTERKQAEAEQERLESELRQSQKLEAVGQLAAGVAHDFNNKLAVILGYAHLVLRTLDPGAPARADVEEIQTAALHSANLTRQLLAFARMQPITPKLLDLNEAVAGMAQMLDRLLGDGVELLWNPGPGPCRVRIDPGQVDQVLVNMAVNARDAVSGSGTVTIATAHVELDEDYCASHPGAAPGSYVVLEVGDDGCGMDEETKTRAFEPFFTTKAQGKGTGLGLASVHGIAHQNHGFADVESHLGRGTTIRIYLPQEA
jgi:PAS domain S-box-containing protein